MNGSCSLNGSGTTGTNTPAVKAALVIHHHPYLRSLPGTPDAVIILFPDMAESMLLEVFTHTGQKSDLAGEDCILKFSYLSRDADRFLARNGGMILAMQVKAADLAPVRDPCFIQFAVEHVGIYPADSRALLIDPAPPFLKENTRAISISLRTGRVSCSIECPVLVAEIIERHRLKGEGISFPDPLHIPVEEEDMAVECPGAAPAAEVTGEAYFPDNSTELFFGISSQFFAFTALCTNHVSEDSG